MASRKTTVLILIYIVILVVLLANRKLHWQAAPRRRAPPSDSPADFSFLAQPEYIFAFGDSYTAENWNPQTNPLDPYPRTSAADGPVWARNLSQSYTKPARLVNLAISGATISNNVLGHWYGPLDLAGQAKAFLKYLTPYDRRASWHGFNSLFSIEIGTNDVHLSYNGTETMRRTGQTEAELHEELMQRYVDVVDALYNVGARAFTFHLVLPFDRARAGIDLPMKDRIRLKESIMRYNGALRSAMHTYCARKSDEMNGHIFCSVIETFVLANKVMDSPKKYGIREPFDYCDAYQHRWSALPDFDSDPSCVGPVGAYMWKDNLHPAYTFHGHWARLTQEQVLREMPRNPDMYNSAVFVEQGS